MGKEPRTIYYSDELKDEFAGDSIEAVKIDKTYDYFGGKKRKIQRAFWYKCIFRPLIAPLYLKLKFGHKIVNRACMDRKTKGGFFVYGNHTNNIPDAFIPSMIMRPKDVYVIVHPNNVSMPVLGPIIPALGGLPLPDDLDAMRNFNSAISRYCEEGNAITIYPEAHIWPYYTKIRPFDEKSFGYPITQNAPVYCFTNTYRKRRFFKTPRIVTYVDGPFYAPEEGTTREKKKALRDMVYNAMVKASANNNVEYIKYIKKEKGKEE